MSLLFKVVEGAAPASEFGPFAYLCSHFSKEVFLSFHGRTSEENRVRMTIPYAKTSEIDLCTN